MLKFEPLELIERLEKIDLTNIDLDLYLDGEIFNLKKRNLKIYTKQDLIEMVESLSSELGDKKKEISDACENLRDLIIDLRLYEINQRDKKRIKKVIKGKLKNVRP